MNQEKFTKSAEELFSGGTTVARNAGHSQLVPAHLLAAFFGQSDLASRVAEKAGVTTADVLVGLNVALQKVPQQDPPPSQLSPSSELVKALTAAGKRASKLGDSFISVDSLVYCCLDAKTVVDAFKRPSAGGAGGAVVSDKMLKDAVGTLRGASGVHTSDAEQSFEVLSKYGVDLTDLAREGKIDPVIGRDSLVRRVTEVLTRRTKCNPCLVGAGGTGKTAIVELLAQRIVNGDVPTSLRDVRVFSLDMGALVAGASHHGEFEQRLKAVIDEIKSSNGSIILFIDEIHMLLGAGGGSGAMDAANLLKPSLARGELRLIGATTTPEYRKYIEKDAAFERRLAVVKVEEPSVEDTISILRGISDKYSSHFGIRITDDALRAAAELSARYINDRMLPDKAIDLMDEACSRVRVQLDSSPEELEMLERRVLRLQIELQAIRKEKANSPAVTALEEQIAELQEQLMPMKARLEHEREKTTKLSTLKRKLEELEIKADAAERSRNLELAADLRYGAIPAVREDLDRLTKQLEADELAALNNMDVDAGAEPPKVSESIVTADTIADVVSRWTHIPVSRLNKSERARLLELESELSSQVFGQPEAIKSVVAAIQRSKAGLGDPRLPLGVFLFLGTSGTGKTFLAKAISKALFDEEKIIRIDMGEYGEKHTYSKLIGAPAGYVGHDEGGVLTNAVRTNPHSVIVLDEVEKAHPDVLNVFLAIFSEGIITDSKGQVVNFKNCVFVLTSNLGANALLADEPDAHDQVMAAVRRHFKPEVINRFSDMVIFNRLTRDHLRQVCKAQLGEVEKRLGAQGIGLDVTVPALDVLIEGGWDPDYGARPMQRFIEKELVTKLARHVLGSAIGPEDGACFVVGVDAATGDLAFELVYRKDEGADSAAPPSPKRLKTNS